MPCTVHVNVLVGSSRHWSRQSCRNNRSASETWRSNSNQSNSTVNASWGTFCLLDCGFTARDCHQRNLFHEFLCNELKRDRFGDVNCHMHKHTTFILLCVGPIVVLDFFWILANNTRRTMKLSLALSRSTRNSNACDWASETQCFDRRMTVAFL